MNESVEIDHRQGEWMGTPRSGEVVKSERSIERVRDHDAWMLSRFWLR